MKKNIFNLMVFASLFFVACNNENNNTSSLSMDEDSIPIQKKYGIKSGIVTFETMVETSGMQVAGKKILYFDNYGLKECEETYEKDKLVISFFSDGEKLYNLSYDNNMAYITDTASKGGTALRFDGNQITQQNKDAESVQKLPNETIAEKDCEAYTVFNKSAETTTKFAGWNHICLLTDLSSKTIKSVYKAVKIEENVEIPAEKFIVPAGFTIQ